MLLRSAVRGGRAVSAASRCQARASQTLQLGLVPKASWRQRHSAQVPRLDPSVCRPQRVWEGPRGRGLPDRCRWHWAAEVLPAQRGPLRATIPPTAQTAAPHKLLHERLPQLRVGGVCRGAAAALPGWRGAGPSCPGGARDRREPQGLPQDGDPASREVGRLSQPGPALAEGSCPGSSTASSVCGPSRACVGWKSEELFIDFP